MSRVIILALLLSMIGRAQGSCPEFVEFTPDVILDDGISSTRLEVKARENTQSVTLVLPAGTPVKIGSISGCDGAMALPLHDDGTGGDLQAGDNVFTLDNITWDPSAPPECDTGFLPFFRFGPAFEGHRRMTLGEFVVARDDQETLYVDQGTYMLHVLSSQEFVQADRVDKVAFDVQVASHVINLIDKERIIASGSADFEALGHSFYSRFPDEYDFLNFIGSEYALQLHDAGPDGRCRVGPLFFGAIHPIAKNVVEGIGTDIFDETAAWGSAGKLLGVNMVTKQLVHSNGVFLHETTHQWAARLDESLGLSIPSHWFSNNSVGGWVGGCVWSDNGDGTYTILGDAAAMNRTGDLELYLMGVLPANEVEAIYVAATKPGFGNCEVGAIIEGPFTEITIGDIQRIEGARRPGVADSQKDFRTAMVVTTSERFLTPLEITLYNRISQLFDGLLDPGNGRSSWSFASVTEGRATMGTRVQTERISPRLSFGPGYLVFKALEGNSMPPPQRLVVINAGGGTLDWTASTDVPWLVLNQSEPGDLLQVLPPRRAETTSEVNGSVGPGGQSEPEILVSVDPSTLGTGVHEAVITVLARAEQHSIPVRLTVEGDLAAKPEISAAGVVNAASFVSGAVAPGEIISIFGTAMGPVEGVGTSLSAAGNVDTSLAEVKVLFDGIAAPLFFVRQDQINAQVPYAVAEQSTTRIEVIYEGRQSKEIVVPVAPSAPGIFAYEDDRNRAVVLNQDGTFNSPSNPAARGDIIVFFATGEGQTDPAGIDGKLSEAPFPQPILPVSVMIGGAEASVLFAGSAPGFAGLLQVNVRVPLGAAVGATAPLVLVVGSMQGPVPTLAIAPGS